MLVGLERTSTVKRVCLVNTKPVLGLRNAWVVERANIPQRPQSAVYIVQPARTRQTTDQSVSRVQRIRTLRPGVPTLRSASAMLVRWEFTLIALRVWLANIYTPRTLWSALIVELGNIPTDPQWAVCHVLLARTRRTTDQSVCCVLQIHTLWAGVTTLRSAHAMLAPRESTVIAPRVWLANTSPPRILRSALIVELGNIPTYPQWAV